MKSLKYTAVILLTIFFATSCQKDSPLEPINNNESSNSSGQPMPSITESADINGILATVYYDFDSGLPGVPVVGLVMGYAQFGSMIDGGTVSINNNDLSKNTQDGKVFYIKPGPGSTTLLGNVTFDNSMHQWSVSGNGEISSFSGEVKSPRIFDVTSPKNNSIISKSTGITINWTITGLSDEKILINLISVSDSKSIVSEQNLPNNGSYKIESSKISSLSGEISYKLLNIEKFLPIIKTT